MQYIQRFNVLPHKSEAFRDWLKANDKMLRNEQPKGWRYLGAWFTVHGFGQYDCEIRYEIDDYASLGAGFGSETLQKAWGEIFDALAPNQGETVLMKSAGEVMIMKGA
jgi:hypothetical protein